MQFYKEEQIKFIFISNQFKLKISLYKNSNLPQ